ncbi:MAG: galactose-1-phosphate uridylyltransferase [bacterium]|nr:galactose-1-phosphate uridylyltransferase [bacterium]
MPELRRDPVIGRWVIISTERGRRPSEYKEEEEINPDKPCPFCPGNEHATPPEIMAYRTPDSKKNEKGWWVRVVPNKYPALQIEGELNSRGDGVYDLMNGIGAHEVIIENPGHKTEMDTADIKNVEDVFWMFRDRILDLRNDRRFEYILIFKNKGSAAGATLTHPHAQLIATPMVPIRVHQEIQGGLRYYEYKNRCIYCDIIKQELEEDVRLILENNDFVAISPFASRFPFEIMILPKRHDSHFEDLQKAEAMNLAKIMKEVLKKLVAALENPPYNYIIHNSPLKSGMLNHYHWHIEIIPKLVKVAGFEWGTGFYINPTPPEEATKLLKEV